MERTLADLDASRSPGPSASRPGGTLERVAGRWLGWLFSAVLVALLAVSVLVGRFEPPHRGIGTVFLGAYLQGFGLAMLASRFFPDGSWLFRALRWLCEHSRLAADHTVLALFALTFGMGTVVVLVGLGVATP